MTIGHFDLPMRWESESWAEDVGPVYEWLSARPALPAAPGPSAEVAGATAAAAEDITMEPMVITVPAARREALLRGAGWIKVNLQFIVTDFNSNPMEWHTCWVQYQGPHGEENQARSELRRGGGGVASFGDFWIKPQGILRFLAIPAAGMPGEVLLDGSVPVPAQIRNSYLAYTVEQQYREIQIRAASQEAVGEKMQIQGSVKFSIMKVVEIGGGGGKDWSTGQTTTDEQSWTVRVATNAVTIKQVR
jgi:hypothetical protein